MTSNLPGDPMAFFKPEFINRVDEIIRFRALTEADLGAIVEIQLAHLQDRLAERRIGLEVTPAATALLAHEGYDPAFGARPLKRVIQRELGDRAAMLVLEGKVGEVERSSSTPTTACSRSTPPTPHPSGARPTGAGRPPRRVRPWSATACSSGSLRSRRPTMSNASAPPRLRCRARCLDPGLHVRPRPAPR